MLVAEWVVAHDFPALCLVLLDFIQADNLRAKLTLDAEAVDDLLHDSSSASDFDILVADWAVFVKNQPVFNA